MCSDLIHSVCCIFSYSLLAKINVYKIDIFLKNTNSKFKKIFEHLINICKYFRINKKQCFKWIFTFLTSNVLLERFIYKTGIMASLPQAYSFPSREYFISSSNLSKCWIQFSKLTYFIQNHHGTHRKKDLNDTYKTAAILLKSKDIIDYFVTS